MIAVKLTVPPSTNDLWQVVRTRKGNASLTLQSAYRTWLDLAILKLRMEMPKVKVYPVGVRVIVCEGEGWTASRDLDNVIKPVIDAVKKAGRIEDDSGKYVRRCVVEFGERVAEACVWVCVEPLSQADAAESAA